MEKLINWCIANYGTLAAICTTLFTVFLFGRKWVKDAIRAIILGNKFHTIYGNDPVQCIRELHETIQRSHDTLEIRQCISEKYMQIGIFMCQNTTGKCVWTNQYLNDIFGLDSTDMRGFGWLNSIDPIDRERVHKVWIYSVNNNIPYECNYTIINQRNGNLYKVAAHAISVVDDKDTVVCYIGYMTIVAECILGEKESMEKREIKVVPDA